MGSKKDELICILNLDEEAWNIWSVVRRHKMPLQKETYKLWLSIAGLLIPWLKATFFILKR